MNLTRKLLGSFALASSLVFSSSIHAQSKIPDYLMEYSREKNLPLTETNELEINPINKDIKITHSSLEEGISQMRNLAKRLYLEETWVYILQENLWVETGINESIKETPSRTDLIKILAENNGNKVVFAHIHPNYSFKGFVPTPEDINQLLFSFPFIKGLVVNSRGYSFWSYKSEKLFAPYENMVAKYASCMKKSLPENARLNQNSAREGIEKLAKCADEIGINMEYGFFPKNLR